MLIFMDGFDKLGGLNSNASAVQALLAAGEWTTATGPAGTTTIVAPLSATGQALYYDYATSTPSLLKTLPASYSRLIGGCRFKVVSFGTAVVGIQFRDAAASQCTITINPAGTIGLRNGTATGTVLATSSTSVTQGSTHYLEWDIAFGNTAAYQVWLDGVSIFSGTGDTTTTANNTANVFGFVTTGASGGPEMNWDDLYLFDSTGTTNNAVLLTSPRIETTFPTSDSAVQFAFGAGILGSSVTRSASTITLAVNTVFLRPFTPTVACTVNSISVRGGATSGTINLRGVIYADSGGVAGALMSSGTTVVGLAIGAVTTLPLTTPQSLVAGTRYWLGWMSDIAITSGAAALDDLNAGYRGTATFASGAPGTAPAMTGGQGTYLLWGNLTGVAVNCDEVNNQPPDGALSYVFDATVGHQDLYNFGALSVTPTSVYAVAVKGYVARSDSGAKTISLRAGSGAGSLAGQTPATSFGWMTSVFETDPATGAAWTGPNLNAAQSGVRVDS